MAIEKTILGVAGEFAVAAELCRRNLYAQLTLGHQKRIDLLVVSEARMCRIEVKAKQGREWPNCKGTFGKNSFLVFVDFANRPDDQRPDFYVLTADEWRGLVIAGMEEYQADHPDRRVEVTDDAVLVLHDEVGRYGAYRGMGVRPEKIKAHQEAWQKIARALET
jgi:hypothetical protein